MTEGIKNVLRRNMANALAQGDLPQAALLLQRLKDEDPLSVETRGMELEYFLRSRSLREAQTLADQLLQLFPDSPRIHYLAGQVAYQLKDYVSAAERFRESHRIRPHWRSSLELARTLTQQGKLDEAAAIFESLLPDHPDCFRDLAWLYERQEEYGRALSAIEAYLKVYPDNEWAKSHRLRLRACTMEPEELVRESRGLLDFGEELADSVVPQFLEALFRTGRAAEARQFVTQRRAEFPPRLAASAGWTCYRYQAYDLALDLFMDTLRSNRGNFDVKLLSAVEFAAVRCARVSELIRLYESRATEDQRLYGRLHSLKRRAATPEDGKRKHYGPLTKRC